ncbi:hypothetical protein OK016_28430 [Vibrio chagasii]|nr:hypothetical protein [Vibrio chagasii]
MGIRPTIRCEPYQGEPGGPWAKST